MTTCIDSGRCEYGAIGLNQFYEVGVECWQGYWLGVDGWLYESVETHKENKHMTTI